MSTFPAARIVLRPETRREPWCAAGRSALCSQKGGATLESLGCGRILLGMPGSGFEADEAMTIQQLVDPVEREALAKIAGQDSLNLRPAERRDAVSWRGAGHHSLHETCLLLGRQSSLTTWCRAPAHRLDAAVTIGVRPTLHESATAAYGVSNFQRLPPLQHQQCATQPITLHRVRLFGNQASEPASIATISFEYIHAASLSGGRIIAPVVRWRNMGEQGKGARDSSGGRIRAVPH